MNLEDYVANQDRLEVKREKKKAEADARIDTFLEEEEKKRQAGTPRLPLSKEAKESDFPGYPKGTIPRTLYCSLGPSANHSLCHWSECKCPCHDSSKIAIDEQDWMKQWENYHGY